MESYPTNTDKDFLFWLLAATSNEAKMLPLDHLQRGKNAPTYNGSPKFKSSL